MISQIKKNFKDYIDKNYANWDITIALRYLPIVDDLSRHYKAGDKVLELGSEITGITTYLKIPVTGLDTNFDYSKKNKYLTPVKGSVLKIPFDDDSFDYVLSVDMLEHVSPKLREKAIQEMVRVTRRKLYLSFPCGKKSEQVDQEIRDYYKERKGEDYQYLKEHVEYGLPDEKMVKRLLHANQGKVRVYPNTSLFLWKLLLKWGLSDEKLKSSFYRRALLLTPLLKRFNFGTTYRKLFVLEKT